MDKGKVLSFWKKRAIIEDPDIATHYKKDNSLEYDINLIRKYVHDNCSVLELGCGSGRIINSIEPYVSSIKGIDYQEGLLRFCVQSEKVITRVADVTKYSDGQKYDLIIIFGVMNYVTLEDAKEIYSNCNDMLKPEGTLLVKHACGIEEDVLVDKYSEEIGDWYHAVYRYVKKEQMIIEDQGFKVNLIDIYPQSLNRWSNTHFYAFECKSIKG